MSYVGRGNVWEMVIRTTKEGKGEGNGGKKVWKQQRGADEGRAEWERGKERLPGSHGRLVVIRLATLENGGNET